MENLVKEFKRVGSYIYLYASMFTLSTLHHLTRAKILANPLCSFTVQKKQGKVEVSQRLRCFQESNYMDPSQGLCLGALFDIAATNVKILVHFKRYLWKFNSSLHLMEIGLC